MNFYSDIVAAVRAAVDERNAKRAALGARIRQIAESTLDACALSVLSSPRVTAGATAPPAWTLVVGQVVATCSQWGDGSDSHYAHEDVLLVSVPGERDRVVGEVPDCSYHDGHNLQRQRGVARLAEDGHVVRPAPVALLREIARELPAVVAAALTSRETSVREQAAQAAEALAALPAQ